MRGASLLKADKAFIEKMNVGLTCPEGYDTLTDADIVECDICHRIIQFWHFHTVATKGKGGSSAGAGLDCCNVCRHRFSAAVSASSNPQKSIISISGIDPKGRERTVKMSTALRFYCVGKKSQTQLAAVKDSHATSFLKKMIFQEENPSSVTKEDVFFFVKHNLIEISSNNSGDEQHKKTTRRTLDINETDTLPIKKNRIENTIPLSSSNEFTPSSAVPNPHNFGIFLDDDAATASIALVKLTVHHVLSKDPASDTQLENVNPTISPKQVTSFVGEVDVCQTLECVAPAMAASLDPVEKEMHLCSKNDAQLDCESLSTALPIPLDTPTGLEPCNASVSDALPQITPLVTYSDEPSHFIDDAHSNDVFAQEEKANMISLSTSDCLKSQTECELESTGSPKNNASSGLAFDASPQEPPKASIAELRAALIGYFDSLPSDCGFPNTEDADGPSSRFLVHLQGEAAPEGIVCEGDQSASIGDDDHIVGFRTSGRVMLDVAWIPSVGGQVQHFSILFQSEQSYFLSVWRIICSGGSGGRQRIVSVTCCYKVSLGKRVPLLISWVPVPELMNEERNRIGVCTVVRETTLCTFVLPIHPEGDDVDSDDANEFSGEVISISPQLAGLASLPSEIHSAHWSPFISSLSDLRMFVLLKNGDLHILRHQLEDDISILHAASNATDPMRMIHERVIPCSRHGPRSDNLILAVGLVASRPCVSWSCSGKDVRSLFEPFGASEPVLWETYSVVTAIAFGAKGVTVACDHGAVRLLRDGKDTLVSDAIGVDITSITPFRKEGTLSSTNCYYVGTRANQFLSVKSTSMTAVNSLMEFICTPSTSNALDTDAHIRTSFKVGANSYNKDTLVGHKLGPELSSPSLVADVFWCLRAQEEGQSSCPALCLGVCPDGTSVAFICDDGF